MLRLLTRRTLTTHRPSEAVAETPGASATTGLPRGTISSNPRDIAGRLQPATLLQRPCQLEKSWPALELKDPEQLIPRSFLLGDAHFVPRDIERCLFAVPRGLHLNKTLRAISAERQHVEANTVTSCFGHAFHVVRQTILAQTEQLCALKVDDELLSSAAE